MCKDVSIGIRVYISYGSLMYTITKFVSLYSPIYSCNDCDIINSNNFITDYENIDYDLPQIARARRLLQAVANPYLQESQDFARADAARRRRGGPGQRLMDSLHAKGMRLRKLFVNLQRKTIFNKTLIMKRVGINTVVCAKNPERRRLCGRQGEGPGLMRSRKRQKRVAM